jgi:hypothetical protein
LSSPQTLSTWQWGHQTTSCLIVSECNDLPRFLLTLLSQPHSHWLGVRCQGQETSLSQPHNPGEMVHLCAPVKPNIKKSKTISAQSNTK